mgnify:CR=1 FL=1
MGQETESPLTPQVRALIGVAGDPVECWGEVDPEYLRRFTQALMDPDPMYWDQEYAGGTRYGNITAPPLMASYLPMRQPPSDRASLTRTFEENPGIAGPGRLPSLPTSLSRVIEASEEMEIYKYPGIGDRINFQNRYADIVEQGGRGGGPCLSVTIETTYRNHKSEVLCIIRTSQVRR